SETSRTHLTTRWYAVATVVPGPSTFFAWCSAVLESLDPLDSIVDLHVGSYAEDTRSSVATTRGYRRNRLTTATRLPTFSVSLSSRCSALVSFPVLFRPARRRFCNSRRNRPAPSTPCAL